MNVSRLLLGVFGIIVAATFYVAADDYPRAAAEMPVIYAVAVALLSLAMVLDELVFKRRRLAAREAGGSDMASGSSATSTGGANEPSMRDASPQRAAPAAADKDEATSTGGKRWLAVVAIFALAVAYVLTLQTLGYIFATALFMALALGVIGTVRWPFAVIGSAVLIAMICLVFIGFLGLPIPLLPAFV
ncbi:tripartite tricarboxylate transporter TctB family protein [Salinicola aestuarinus]|uniref:tripartite tricarboxylate transporter TctB family protein n=1 Tax=Salinicola aestuarinus TaxID=1949082 RepID=UPI000DA1622C|nr:tripartite tricarboxylate transporter TctB family protein [Salinicola aestuarinus]